MHFKNINTNMQNLKCKLNSLQSALNNLHKEVFQLKSAKISLESEVILLRKKVDMLKNSPKMQSQPYNFDVYNEVKCRLSREKNILIFNFSDFKQEDLEASLSVSVDLLRFIFT